MISKKDYYLILSYSEDKQGLFCEPLSRLCVLNCVKPQNIFLLNTALLTPRLVANAQVPSCWFWESVVFLHPKSNSKKYIL